MALFEPIFEALSRGGGRYVVVGGVAVVLHGYVRLTADLDLVVDLEPEAARRTVEVLEGLGLVPRAPVAALDFAVRERRDEWIREKGMTVFSLFDTRNPLTPTERLCWLEEALRFAAKTQGRERQAAAPSTEGAGSRSSAPPPPADDPGWRR